jgi:E3 ubiquitin-protein ligase HUWE1
MFDQVKQQILQFLNGFHELIPRELIGIFNNRELELLIAGLPDFNFEDLKNNIEYDGYSSESD